MSDTSTKVPVLTPEEMRDGLYELLQSEARTREYWKQRDANECLIGPHPFGLDTTIASPHGQLDRHVRLIASPGYTDDSVDAMKIMLANHAVPRAHAEGREFRLRIVRIKRLDGWNGNPSQYLHDFYFEVITRVGTFMCGGCNDHSSAGGSGGKQLTQIFRFIAALYAVPLEEVTIPEKEARAGVRLLADAYNASAKGRAA